MTENTTQGTSKKLSLKVLRSSLALTQKELAERAKLHERSITAIERHARPIRLVTAFSVVNALNSVLEEKGRPQVSVNDLDWVLLDSEELSAS